VSPYTTDAKDLEESNKHSKFGNIEIESEANLNRPSLPLPQERNYLNNEESSSFFPTVYSGRNSLKPNSISYLLSSSSKIKNSSLDDFAK